MFIENNVVRVVDLNLRTRLGNCNNPESVAVSVCSNVA